VRCALDVCSTNRCRRADCCFPGAPDGHYFEVPILHVSRSLYRALAAEVGGDWQAVARRRQRVLDACELTVARIEREPDFANPTRFLFDEVRSSFPIGRQEHVRRLIAVHMELAQRAVAAQPPERRPCSALTRRGTPCLREAVGSGDLCPSHRQLTPASERHSDAAVAAGAALPAA